MSFHCTTISSMPCAHFVTIGVKIMCSIVYNLGALELLADAHSRSEVYSFCIAAYKNLGVSTVGGVAQHTV